MSNPPDAASTPVSTYAEVPVGKPGIVIGGAAPSNRRDLKVYDGREPRRIENVEDAETWRLLLNEVTIQLGHELPDCYMARSPGPADVRADWQLFREHPRGYLLVLECVATKRRKNVYVDCRRFVWLPRTISNTIAKLLIVLGIIIGLATILACFRGLRVELALLFLLGIAGAFIFFGIMIMGYTDAYRTATPDVENQSETMLSAAYAAIDEAEGSYR